MKNPETAHVLQGVKTVLFYGSKRVATDPKAAVSIGKLIVIEKQVVNLIRASDMRRQHRAYSCIRFRIASTNFQKESVLQDCVP